MKKYRLTDTSTVVRDDGAYIPADTRNQDHRDYLEWVAAGGVPDPYVPPPPADALDGWEFNHENRIRALEGKPALTPSQFKNKAQVV